MKTVISKDYWKREMRWYIYGSVAIILFPNQSWLYGIKAIINSIEES
jgi:hypothetical protein